MSQTLIMRPEHTCPQWFTVHEQNLFQYGVCHVKTHKTQIWLYHVAVLKFQAIFKQCLLETMLVIHSSLKLLQVTLSNITCIVILI